MGTPSFYMDTRNQNTGPPACIKVLYLLSHLHIPLASYSFPFIFSIGMGMVHLPNNQLFYALVADTTVYTQNVVPSIEEGIAEQGHLFRHKHVTSHIWDPIYSTINWVCGTTQNFF